MPLFLSLYLLDQHCSKYSTGQKSRKWTKKLLAFILDVSRTNGQTIWAINMGIDPRRLKSQEFLWHLILQMVTPHIQRRSLSATFKRTSGIIKSTLEYFSSSPKMIEHSAVSGWSIFIHCCLLGLQG